MLSFITTILLIEEQDVFLLNFQIFVFDLGINPSMVLDVDARQTLIVLGDRFLFYLVEGFPMLAFVVLFHFFVNYTVTSG